MPNSQPASQHPTRPLTLWIGSPDAAGGQVASGQPGWRAGHGARVAGGPAPLQQCVCTGVHSISMNLGGFGSHRLARWGWKAWASRPQLSSQLHAHSSQLPQSKPTQNTVLTGMPIRPARQHMPTRQAIHACQLTHSTQRSHVMPAGRRYRQPYCSPPRPAATALAYVPAEGAGEGPPLRGTHEKGSAPSALQGGGIGRGGCGQHENFWWAEGRASALQHLCASSSQVE